MSVHVFSWCCGVTVLRHILWKEGEKGLNKWEGKASGKIKTLEFSHETINETAPRRWGDSAKDKVISKAAEAAAIAHSRNLSAFECFANSWTPRSLGCLSFRCKPLHCAPSADGRGHRFQSPKRSAQERGADGASTLSERSGGHTTTAQPIAQHFERSTTFIYRKRCTTLSIIEEIK